MISVLRMDDLLGLLPSLIALLEEGSVTHAAKRMGISQPRMSARLTTLRSVLGDPLLVAASGRRGLVATDRGRAIAQAARESVRGLTNVVHEQAFDPRTSKRIFAIMANDNAAALAALPLVTRVRATAGPDIRVALHQFDIGRLEELENGTLDMALGAQWQFDTMSTLTTRAVLHDTFASAVGLDGEGAESLEAYCSREHVMVSSDGGGFDGLVDRALAKIGRRRRVVLSVQSYLLALEAVRSSDLVATLPRSLLTGWGEGLRIFNPPIPLGGFALSAAWHPRSDREAASRWLRSLLCKVS